MSTAAGTSPGSPEPRHSHAIISGGSSGIGLALAARLLADGGRVSLLARDAAKLAVARDHLQTAGASADHIHVCPLDVTHRADTFGAVDACVTRFGAPDWVIASAGAVEPGTFAELTIEAHRTQMEVNHFGAIHLAQAAISHMERAGGGRLVFVSSGAAIAGVHGYAAYGPSKFALRGLAETLRVELRPVGISVTLALPPDTETPQLAAELPCRGHVTSAVAAFAGRWSPEKVALSILRSARNGRFVSTPGWRLSLFYRFHSVISPVFRGYQNWIARQNRADPQ
jgi:3-dehydrosphinganine reductase